MGVFFGVFFVHLHNLWSDVAHSAAFHVYVLFIGFGGQSKVAEYPLVLLFTVDNILRFNVAVHDLPRVKVVQSRKAVTDDLADELSRVYALVLHHVFQGSA